MDHDEPIKLFDTAAAPTYDRRIGLHAILVSLVVLVLFIGLAAVASMRKPAQSDADDPGLSPPVKHDVAASPRLIEGPEFKKLERLATLAPVNFDTRRYHVFRLTPQRICADLGTALTGSPSAWNVGELDASIWECMVGPWPRDPPGASQPAEGQRDSFFMLLRGGSREQITKTTVKLGFGDASTRADFAARVLGALDAIPELALPPGMLDAVTANAPGTLNADGTTANLRKEVLDPARLFMVVTYRASAAMTLPPHVGACAAPFGPRGALPAASIMPLPAPETASAYPLGICS